ncbi:NAD(P)H-dependent oxidoreductase, partial [Enterobacter cloacae complex sp.6722794]|uniref:NAD(P)H-dependent oxidoreductase n=1 Tax=Enterobacter cloacae complex sp.6722794 TaxID=3397173 RepID=UPI003AF545C4
NLVGRARETFHYTATYPLGLGESGKALVFSARGGIHYGQETDAITPYLKSVLGLMGITDVQFIYAEGLDMKPEGYEAGIAKAQQQLMHHVHC